MPDWVPTLVKWFGWSPPEWLFGVVGLLLSAGFIRALWELGNFYLTRRKEAAERIEASKQTRQRAYEEAYWRLEERYFELLAMAMRYPGMNVRLGDGDDDPVDPADSTRRKIYYEMLFSLCERAYLDRESTPEIFQYQWPGWRDYIEAHLRRPSCRREWAAQLPGTIENSYGLDRRFEQECVMPILAKITRQERMVVAATNPSLPSVVTARM